MNQGVDLDLRQVRPLERGTFDPPAIRLLRAVVDLLILLRPWFIPVPVLPFVAGRLLADPGLSLGSAVSDRALWQGAASLALTWCVVAIVNDCCDQAADADNPRRQSSVMVIRRWGRVRLLVGAGVITGIDLALAASLEMTFVLGTAAVLLLGLAYSTPPVRLKARPGLDVLANAVPVGVLAPLAGWQLIAAPITFPWPMALLGLLTAAALYLPTTIIDLDADRRAGVRTTAVALGQRSSYWVGMIIWCAASVLSLVMSVSGVLLPIEPTWPQLVAWAAAASSYPILMRNPTIGRLAVISIAIGIHALSMVGTYLAVL